MITGNGFETLVASDPDHERVFAEIYFDGRFVAVISQERAEGLFDLETPATGLSEPMVTRVVALDGFLRAVNHACARLSGNA